MMRLMRKNFIEDWPLYRSYKFIALQELMILLPIGSAYILYIIGHIKKKNTVDGSGEDDFGLQSLLTKETADNDDSQTQIKNNNLVHKLTTHL